MQELERVWLAQTKFVGDGDAKEPSLPAIAVSECSLLPEDSRTIHFLVQSVSEAMEVRMFANLFAISQVCYVLSC